VPGVNDVQIPRWDDILRRLAGVRQTGAVSPVLASEILPGVILENDRPEFAFLGRDYIATGGGGGTATLTNDNWVAFSNPTGSGKLMVLEGATWSYSDPGTTYGVAVFLATYASVSAFGVASIGGPRDTRWYAKYGTTPPEVGVRGEIRVVTNVLLPAVLQRLNNVRVSGVRFVPNCLMTPVVLSPGFSVVLGGNSPAVAGFGCDFSWRERPLEPDEEP